MIVTFINHSRALVLKFSLKVKLFQKQQGNQESGVWVVLLVFAVIHKMDILSGWLSQGVL